MADAATLGITTQDITLQTDDGYTLAATLFEPVQPSQRVILINSAMGVKRGYYAAFAQYLAECGYVALIYDYRGIGDSRDGTGTLRGFRASILDWAACDQTAALKWLFNRYPDAVLSIVGHSLGGQIIGLTPMGERVHKLLAVGSQAGYWRLWDGVERAKVALFWFCVIPTLTALMGYLPSQRLGLGEDLPAGVARDWGRGGRSRRYLLDLYGGGAHDLYSTISAKIRLISLADDNTFAPRRAVEALRSFYPNAESEHLHIRPADVNAPKIGHFGFFRPSFRETLWAEAVAWLS